MKEKEEARLLLLKEQENDLRKKGFEKIQDQGTNRWRYPWKMLTTRGRERHLPQYKNKKMGKMKKKVNEERKIKKGKKESSRRKPAKDVL